VWTGGAPQPIDHRVTRRLIERTVVHARPDDDGPVAAVSLAQLDVVQIGGTGERREIEGQHDGIRVHGFVRDRRLDPTVLSMDAIRTVGVPAYGMSDTDQIELPAGTCLFDRAGGEVIGINQVARKRYAIRDAMWPRVYVGTRWGLGLVFVHATGAARFEQCPRRGS
jgi:hypothetical protein